MVDQKSLPRNRNLLDLSTELFEKTEFRHESRPYLKVPFKRHTTSAETHFLYRLCRDLGPGNFVELGTMHGGNTAVMGHGISQGTLHTVDLFELHPLSDKKIALRTPGLLKEYFTDNLPNVSLNVMKSDTSEAAVQLDLPVRFIFIDGDHSYQGCKRDWVAWNEKVGEGGMVAFHDCHFESVNQVIKEIDDSRWEFVRQIYSLKVFKRI